MNGNASSRARILVLYTGGTLGMLPASAGPAKDAPLVPAPWKELQRYLPPLADLPIEVTFRELMAIDSSDMTPDHWLLLARMIAEAYDDFDGCVILHGTDTMTYTGSALSFLLENLSKPVVLTGSQAPLANPLTDARSNLVAALMIAAGPACGLPVIPEVCIAFHTALLRANRSRKVSASAFAGFDSPNHPPLASIGPRIEVRTAAVLPSPESPFRAHDTLERNVLLFDLYPGIQPEIVRSLLGAPGLKGAVLRSFGAGNGPTTPAFLNELQAAAKRGVQLLNVTQCAHGPVQPGLYAAGSSLTAAGAVPGRDMTPEAALTKLMFVLGAGQNPDLIRTSLRGEMS